MLLIDAVLHVVILIEKQTMYNISTQYGATQSHTDVSKRPVCNTGLGMWACLMVIKLYLCTPDINECTQKPHLCKPNGQCFNNVGSFRCVCQRGFAPSSNGTCVGKNSLRYVVFLFSREMHFIFEIFMRLMRIIQARRKQCLFPIRSEMSSPRFH